MFQAGKTYPAQLIDAGLSSTKAGNPQAYMKFKVLAEDATTKEFWWHGGFGEVVKPGKEKCQADITFETLLAAGFGGEDVKDLDKGLLMFMPKDNLLVKLETGVKGELEVKYVNTPRPRKEFTGQVPSLKGRLAAAKQKLGVKPTKQSQDW